MVGVLRLEGHAFPRLRLLPSCLLRTHTSHPHPDAWPHRRWHACTRARVPAARIVARDRQHRQQRQPVAAFVVASVVPTEVQVQPATAAQPSNTVASRPALSETEWNNGKRWYYFGGALVASYFDPNTYSTVSAAKAELIERTKIAARNAMAEQASIYTLVTLHSTADFTTLDTRDYAAYNLSSYNTFLGTQVTNQTATINGETTLTGLYAINPEALDTDPT